MKKILLAATVAALSSTAAFAADLPARTYTKAPAYVAPIYNWTGFYVGGFVGGAFGGNSGFSTNFPGSVVGNRSDSAFFGGGQLGYNYQFAPNWVFGIEGDIGALSGNSRTFTDLGATPVSSARVKNDWLASVTGRLGYTWGPGLIYVKGGAAFRDQKTSTDVAFPVISSGDNTGYTIGGGLEYMFAPAWSAKIEYQYYNFGHTNLAFGPDPTTVNFRSDIHTVKAGINYHFNWGGPVVAKY